MKLKLLLLSLTCFFLNYAKAQNPYFKIEKGDTHFYNYGKDFKTESKQKTKLETLKTTKNINGKTYFVVKNYSGVDDKYDLIITTYMRYGSNGSIYVLENENSKEESVFMPEQPLVKGKSWPGTLYGQKLVSTILSTNETLKTPNKTYTECLVIEGKTEGLITKSYYNKKHGFVATSMIMDGKESFIMYL